MRGMKTGDRVRLTTIPDDVTDGPEFKTRTLMKACVGAVFAVTDVIEGRLALDVGEILGKEPYLETIYVEPEFVELVRESA